MDRDERPENLVPEDQSEADADAAEDDGEAIHDPDGDDFPEQGDDDLLNYPL